MSVKGPVFTDSEKNEFKPIFVKFLSKEYGSKEVLEALGGDKIKAARFKQYSDLMICLLKRDQAQQKQGELIAQRDILIQQNQAREAAIAASRQQAAAGAAKHTGDVRVTPSYKQ